MPELHPALAPLAPLLGSWHGRGHGDYPTIEAFDYLEEVTFSHVGKPFLRYDQRTKAIDDGRPLHAETGYLRCAPDGLVELVLAHPTGITEICEGPHTGGDGLALDLRSVRIGRTGTAKEVDALRRRIRVVGDTLDYTVDMGAVGQPLQLHLTATLTR